MTTRAGLEVNVADGNLIVQTQDMNINGTGPALSLTRYFNDLGSGVSQIGSHNTLSVGNDVHITANAGGSATYQGPSGFQVTFASNGSGGYTSPSTYTGAKLAPITGGGWTLTFNQSGEVYTFNSAGNETKDASANGEAINYAYNSNGTLNTATDTQGRVTSFTNYVGTKVGKISDSTGRYVTYTYTGDQLTSSTDSMGGNWQYQYYDTRGNVNQITDPRGYTDTLTYDSSNRITSIVFNNYTSAATTWMFTYNSGNTVVTDPHSHTTTYNYDALGRVTTVVNGVGDSVGSTWDANNNQTASTDPSTYATTLTYDSLNNLTATQNPSLASGNAGAQNTNTYGSTAHPYLPVSSNDAAGNQVAYSYDTNGNVTATTNSSAGGAGMGTVTNKLQGDPNGTGGTISCGAQPGQICSSIDANGNTTTYTYDSVGNLLTVTPPGPVTHQTYTYDALSRPITYTDGNGSKVTISYDNFDRPTQLVYANGGANVTYQYDTDGNMTQRTDGAGTTIWTYDGYNRITKITQTGQSDINYTYDAVGNVKTEQGNAGTITYTYDAANQIAGVNQSVNSANETFTFTNGRPTSVSIPGGITETIAYDRAGRETSINAVKSGTILVSYTGTYTTSAGHDTELLQSETNNVTGITTTYGYDGLNRLTSASATGSGSNSYTYTYDSNGNRTQNSHNGTYSAIYGFNAANELATSGGATDGSYDQAGNQLSTGAGLSFGYNPKNQTTSFTPPSVSTITAGYLDADQTGRTSIGSTSEQNGALGLYSDTTGSTTSYFTHLPSGDKQTLGEVVGSNAYYFLTDLQGSVVAATDTSGTVQATYSYDPYGTSLGTTGSISNPIRYDGGYYDNATGLYKFGERYYNSTDARWTQLDPSGQNVGYFYAGDNPINEIDLTGTSLVGDIAYGCIGSAAVVGATGILASPFSDGASLGAAAEYAPTACINGAVAGFIYHYIAGGTTVHDEPSTSRDFLERLTGL
jgi:RHS repeat-associated protein